MTNRKIMFLVPTLDTGGGEKFVSELSLNLPSNIERIIVLLEEKVSYPYQGKLISLDVPFSKSFFPKLYYFFISVLRFKKIVNKEKPDWVISIGHAQNIINFLATGKTILWVANFLSGHYHNFWGRVYKILVKLLFNKAKKIVACSEFIKEDLVKNFGIKKEKIKVIYISVNIEAIQRLANEPMEPAHQDIFKKPTIINMGRLGEQKGQWHLIKAFKEAKKQNKDLNLAILGDGELKSSLQQLVKDLNLENDVFFLGWQKNPYKFLSKSKLFVLSSLWEGMPTVILEAMACGIPVVSSDCQSGPREILAPGTSIDYQTTEIEYTPYGILVPTENEKLLSEAIIKTLTDTRLSESLIKKSKQRVEEFDIKKIIEQWDNSFDIDKNENSGKINKHYA